MPPELDPYILSTMTDAERASIQEEPTPEEIAAIAAIANGAEDGPDDEEDDDDDVVTDPPAKVEADPAAKAAGAVVADPAAKVDPAAADPAKTDPDPVETAFQPSYQAKLPEDFAAQETAIKDQSEALVTRFKAGEIDFDQYQIEAATLNKSERALDEIRLKATLSQEMTAQTAEQQWNFTIQRFMAATAKTDGIDYSKDDAKRLDLDLFVRTLANSEKNADKPAEWFLTEAHRRVKALHGIGVAAAPVVDDAKDSRKSPLAAAPKTLAQVPGSDGPGDVDGNEFSEVDRLKGDAQEEAIAKMSPSQRERYMNGA